MPLPSALKEGDSSNQASSVRAVIPPLASSRRYRLTSNGRVSEWKTRLPPSGDQSIGPSIPRR